MTPTTTLCADALLVAPDRTVLLLQRKYPPHEKEWGLPGGHCDFGEHPQETAIRELREETGLDAVRSSLMDIFFDPVSDERIHMVTVYQVTRYGGNFRLSGEHLNSGWFSKEKWPPLTPLTAQVLERYFDGY